MTGISLQKRSPHFVRRLVTGKRTRRPRLPRGGFCVQINP